MRLSLMKVFVFLVPIARCIFSLECSARELIVTEPHTLDFCGSCGSGVRCFEVRVVWCRGSDVQLSNEIERAVAEAKAQGLKEVSLCAKSLQPPLTIRLCRMGVRL